MTVEGRVEVFVVSAAARCGSTGRCSAWLRGWEFDGWKALVEVADQEPKQQPKHPVEQLRGSG